MTGIIVYPERVPQLGHTFSESLEERAFSANTLEVSRKIQSLRNRPSPASVRKVLDTLSSEDPLQERLFDALAGVKILTSTVAMHLDQEWRKRLFSQLDSLHEVEEWEPGDQPIQQSSFATFLKAMLTIKPERRPGLGLSHAGNLIAAWTTGHDHLTIEFLLHDRIRWVLSRHFGNDTERFAGETGVARLTESLANYHPEHWFSYVQKNNKPTGR